MTTKTEFLATLALNYSEHMKSHPGYYIGQCSAEACAKNSLKMIASGELYDLSAPMRTTMKQLGVKGKVDLVVLALSKS